MTGEVSIDPAKLDALFAPFAPPGGPGFAVGIAHKGVPIYRRGFGLASAELPVTLTPSTRMRIGSTTKHFGALCVMLLAEDGKLSPQDSLRRHLPELPGWADAVTLAQVMSHTAGVRCSIDVRGYFDGIIGKAVTVPEGAEFRLLASLDSLNFAPGDNWSYSNGGYALLTAAIERVSGAKWGEFLKARVLVPLGMNDTLDRPLDTDCVPNSAALHVKRADGSGFDKGFFGMPVSAAGSLVSTVDDMLRWLAHMSKPVVGTAATWDAMRTPARLNNGASTAYGLGLITSDYRGLRTLHHGGSVVGGNSQMLKVLGHELDVALMVNSDAVSAHDLTEKLLDACVTGLPEKREPGKGANLSGTFYSRQSARALSLVEHEGKTFVKAGKDQAPVPRDPDGNLLMRASFMDLHPAVPTSDGLTLTEFGIADHYERVSPPAASETPAILGRYVNKASGLLLAVEAGKDGTPAILVLRGGLGEMCYRLEELAPGVWKGSAMEGKMPLAPVIERDGDALLMTSSRNLRLRFERA